MLNNIIDDDRREIIVTNVPRLNKAEALINSQ